MPESPGAGSRNGSPPIACGDGRVRGRDGDVGRRADPGRQHPGGPGLVRDRQPAVGAVPRWPAGPLPVRVAGPGRAGGGSEGDLLEVGPALDELRATGATVTTVFLDASTPTLVRRYGDTKRRHPLLGEIGSVGGAIEEERRRLGTVLVGGHRDRHERPERARPAPPGRRALRRRRRPRHHAGHRDVVRLQVRRAARRRPGHRLPLPAEPPLGGGVAADDGPGDPVQDTWRASS